MKKTVTRKPRVRKVKSADYTATIKLMGQTFRSTGGSVKEALEALRVGNIAKGVSVLTVSKDGKSASKILPPSQTFRLFSSSKLMRELAIKNVGLMFDQI